MRIILCSTAFADVPGGVSSEFDNKPLAIAAGVTKRMPNGPCLRDRTAYVGPIASGFPADARRQSRTMGDAWRLRQMPGRVRAAKAFEWRSLVATPAPALLTSNRPAQHCRLVCHRPGDQRNYHRRIFVWRNAESCGGSQRKQPQDHQSCNPDFIRRCGKQRGMWMENQHGDGNACATKPHNQHNNPLTGGAICLPTERWRSATRGLYCSAARWPGIRCGTSGVGRMASWQRQQHQRRWILGPNGDTSATATLVAPLLHLQRARSALCMQGNVNAMGLCERHSTSQCGRATISPMLQPIPPFRRAAFAATLHTKLIMRHSRRSAAGSASPKQLTSGGSASLRLACS